MFELVKKRGLYYPTKDFQNKAYIKDLSIYKQAIQNPVKFWENLARELFWFKKWEKAFVHNPPNFQWFKGGKLNITSNIFENNPKGFEKIKNKAALIWEPESSEEKQRIFTYYDLFRKINKLANALKKLGIKKGDRVGIYLPMIPETIIAMLACARIGAVHVVVFSAFSPVALKVRLQNTGAKILITGDGYYRRGKIINLKRNADKAVKNTKVKKIIVVNRAGNKVRMKKTRDFWYGALTKNENDYCKPAVMDSEDLLFILPTSGSTGVPKGTMHVCGGYAVQAYYTGKWIFDLKEDDIFWSTADIGWITGHTYSCYGPLLNGTTFVIYEGSLDWPAPDRWAQVIEKYGVTIFYTAPTAIRMFIKHGKNFLKKHKFYTLRLLGSVGEPIDETSWHWYFKEIGRKRCPLVDTWWQTETGGILITSLPGVGPFKPCFTGLPFPGVRCDILDENGKSCDLEKRGNLVVLPPFAPGLLRGVYRNPKRYLNTYWSRYGKNIYFTSDAAFKDKYGLIRIVGRVDDVIKVAGHRLCTGELENAISLHKDIAESAVIGVPDRIKGEVPVAFIVLENAFFSKKRSPNIIKEIKKQVVEQVKKEIGPIAPPKKVLLVKDLPKTRSGKIMRRILRKIFTGEELGDLSTLANPETVKEIKQLIHKI